MNNKKTYIIISIISLLLFILLININGISALDKQVNSYIAGVQIPFLVSIAKIIGIIFEPIYVITACLIISIAIFFFGKKKEAILFGATMLVSGGIIFVLKEIITKTRPENALVLESSSSFPSGHAFISLILAGFVIYYLVSKIKSRTKRIILDILMVLLVLLIGFSRIYLHVHWFSDVIAGFLLGMGVLLEVLALEK